MTYSSGPRVQQKPQATSTIRYGSSKHKQSPCTWNQILLFQSSFPQQGCLTILFADMLHEGVWYNPLRDTSIRVICRWSWEGSSEYNQSGLILEKIESRIVLEDWVLVEISDLHREIEEQRLGSDGGKTGTREQWRLIQEDPCPLLHVALHTLFSWSLISYISPLVWSEPSMYLLSGVSGSFVVSPPFILLFLYFLLT